MFTVHKYPLHNIQYPGIDVMMPKGAEILGVQMQQGIPVLWAMCDNEAETVIRKFRAYCTGQDIGSPFQKYIGTIQDDGDGYVLHVFEH